MRVSITVMANAPVKLLQNSEFLFSFFRTVEIAFYRARTHARVSYRIKGQNLQYKNIFGDKKKKTWNHNCLKYVRPYLHMCKWFSRIIQPWDTIVIESKIHSNQIQNMRKPHHVFCSYFFFKLFHTMLLLLFFFCSSYHSLSHCPQISINSKDLYVYFWFSELKCVKKIK